MAPVHAPQKTARLDYFSPLTEMHSPFGPYSTMDAFGQTQTPLFVQSDLWDHERPPSFDGVLQERRQPPRRACTVKALAEMTWMQENATTQMLGCRDQQALVYAVDEPARVELPSLLGSFSSPHTYTTDEHMAKTSSWEFETQQDIRSFVPGEEWLNAGMQEFLNIGKVEADAEASVRCALLPECLAEDVFDEMPAEFGAGRGLWETGTLFPAPSALNIGSANHAEGTCKPCAFMTTKGCKDGTNCAFCHLCQPGEKKRRKKEKRAYMSQSWRAQNGRF